MIGKDWTQKTSGVVLASIASLYVLPRIVKPTIAIETGCATGWTSSLLLAAMRRNGFGTLYSIDIPARKGHLSMDWTLPGDLQPGFLIPESWRGSWKLLLGNSRTLLIPLLEEVGPIDLFYHDSDHTYVHMMWEYTSVLPYLRQNGHLISDDIGWNLSFDHFSREIAERPVVFRENPNFGALTRHR